MIIYPEIEELRMNHCRRCNHRKVVTPLLTCTISAGRNCRELSAENTCPEGRFALPSPIPYRPPYRIPEGYDVEAEKRRLKQGGCCHGSDAKE